MTDTRTRFLTDGTVHLPAALDPDTLALAESAWRWSIDHPGPGSARIYANRLVRVGDIRAARTLDETAETGFFYQDLSHPDSWGYTSRW